MKVVANILKDFRNAPPPKMLIDVENWIFSSCEKWNWQVSSFSLHSIRKSKCLWLPWRRDNSETTQIQKVTEYQYLPYWTKKSFRTDTMSVLESKRKDKTKSWRFRPLTTFITSTWRHCFLTLLAIYILRIRNNQNHFIANKLHKKVSRHARTSPICYYFLKT